MEIILATRNPSKALQIQEIFGDSGIRILTMDEAGITGEAYEREKGTFESNAFLKARYVREQKPGAWVMADDSGICITAYGGEPGVNTAYWAGREATTEQITLFVMGMMRDKKDRSAIFRTVVALITPSGEEHVFEGSVPGTLLKEPRVAAQPKMPYSPLFVPHGQTKSFAEMSTEEENAISHRGQAFRKVREFLERVNKEAA